MTTGVSSQEPIDSAAVKEPSSHTARLTRTELRRRLWHMAPGLLPFVMWYFPHRDPISPTMRGIMVAVVFGLAIGIFAGYRRIRRQGESNQRLAAVAGYAASVLLTLIAFPNDAELGLTVLAILAFGDGSATLGGLLIGGPKLPWNRKKTVSGFFCFLIVGGAMASFIYWGETQMNPEAVPPFATIRTALICGGLAALLAAVVESIPSRINDNVRVGAVAAATVVITHAAIVGGS
jgi:dolichol kinase